MPASILAVDIGGTSSRFAHFELKAEQGLQLSESIWLNTKEAASFSDLLTQFSKVDFSLSLSDAAICVFAVAGPVEGGRYSRPPNISWDVDLESAAPAFGIKSFALINDFLAQAFACLSNPGQEAEEILPGKPINGSPIAVIGAGTGLGKALLVPNFSGGFSGLPSEGGHTNFAAENEEEFAFQKFLQKKIDRSKYLVWDEVVSGRGLSRIHEFLSGETVEPREVAGRAAALGSDTMNWFSKFYARVCRNFVLDTLSLAGVYIAGGVAAKNPEVLKSKEFEKSFRSSETHEDILSVVPLWLMDNQESGLWGAAEYGRQVIFSGA